VQSCGITVASIRTKTVEMICYIAIIGVDNFYYSTVVCRVLIFTNAVRCIAQNGKDNL
jgi:hypothetical protein